MSNILNYRTIEKLYESANSLIYRGILQPDNQPIILKILKQDYPTPAEITRYKQEYEITHSLNAENIIRVYNLQRYKNSLIILLEDFGGQSLNLLISQHQFSLEELLIIAIKITDGLAAIYTANIIHKDINPANIVYNRATGQLKIIDFGISTRSAQENQIGCHINQLEGTLAYIAPEQTGRMNRQIDYRSDFYSLGVTLYEILTLQLPFASKDPMELVHCHIAQQPKRPDELNPSIPLIVSQIVVKLLAKTPEERYQSVWGIKADLETCLQQLQTRGQIFTFPLGSQDISDRFHIPQKLYGREAEISQLLTTFDRVSQGKTEMILVSGYSGIGKSALVNEIYKPITRQRGYFIRGKFDQFQRYIPYTAITQAFQDLIRQLLNEDQITLDNWKTKILAALGSYSQIIIDVIPELEKIIGKQPSVEELGATENLNRFNLFFTRFIGIFSQKEHPLVIFFDDLQWADLSSLNLIERLMTNINSQYLLIIGAYRDNEVSPTHSLICILDKIQKAKATVNQIILQPLRIDHTNELIADTLKCSLEDTKPLAELLNKKTDGNSFFLTQLLQTLYREKLLVFNTPKISPISPKNIESKEHLWHWDIEQINSVEITDNIVDLMIRKIEKLDENTKNVLKLSACIGNQFDLGILAVVNRKSQIFTYQELEPALKEGLIFCLTTEYKLSLIGNQEEMSSNTTKIASTFTPIYEQSIIYKFLHDRVQQAAYVLIPDIEKKAAHLKIGQLLLKNLDDKIVEEKIFDIVNQLNIGAELITNQAERYKLAELNLTAGNKARDSNAYESAVKFFRLGLEMLAEDSWQTYYQLTLALHIGTIEAEYLNTNFEQAEPLFENVIHNSRNILDRVNVYEKKIKFYISQSRLREALDMDLHVLEILGVSLSLSPPIEIEIEDLVNLPVMTDPSKLAAMRMLMTATPAAYVANPTLLPLISFTMVNLCLQYGNSPLAAYAYGCYGLILCGPLQDIESGYRFGKLSLNVSEKFNAQELKAKICQLYNVFIKCWKEHIRESIEPLQEGIQVGLETGDLEYAGYNAAIAVWQTFFSGENLEIVYTKQVQYLELVQSIKQDHSIYLILILQQITLDLLQGVKNDSYLEGEVFNSSIMQRLTENIAVIADAYLARIIACYLFGSYIQAIEYAQITKPYEIAMAGCVLAVQYNFYYSLAILALHIHAAESASLAPQELTIDLDYVKVNQQKLKQWAFHAPVNYQHKYDLVEAEKSRLLEMTLVAMQYYDKAIRGANNSGYIQEEALAYERAAGFYLSIGMEEFGHLYLINAHHCYTRWGAKAKIKQLEEKYSEYFIGATDKTRFKRLDTTTSTTDNDGKILDLTTVIKASQVITGEIVLSNLLKKLMKIMIENAGAQKGFLLLNSPGNLGNNQSQWVIEAVGTVDTDDVTVLQSIPVGYIEPCNQTSLLSVAIINYVAHTQENLVLSDATLSGQFTRDPYIIATQPKSILCAPLLHQGKLSGILYLENNLTTGVFTPERLEVLNILSSQAAISIENSRLYATLEQKVAERTQELSQTLEILQATQAKLEFENALLKPTEQGSSYSYQVGGSLSSDAPTYVVRSADRYLYKALMQGDFCYILNTRQMGKSSLMVRMMKHLQQEGLCCAAIDMTRLGSEDVTAEQWYKGLAVELWQSFDLVGKVNLKSWWKEQFNLSPVQRLSRFFDEIILREVKLADDTVAPQIVIFLDELDCILGLDFAVNDFFALVRSCYNQRGINSAYKRLCFVLLGVATPSDLITDHYRTPFNIGQAIEIKGFKLDEAQPLLQGLTNKVNNPQAVLKEVLFWTNGQPFLTQKICSLIRNSSNAIAQKVAQVWIEDLVRKNIIENWEAQDEPEHLRTIRDRILKGEKDINKMLKLYQQVLEQGQVSLIDTPESRELILSGLLIKHEGHLIVHNRIYELIFNSDWVRMNQQ